jgi:hypothetical protein
MEKEFVPYDFALRMKALGFDKPCFAFYQIEYNEDIPVMVDDDNQYRISGFRTCKNSEIPAHYTTTPTWQSAFRWFREKYNLQSEIKFRHCEYSFKINFQKLADGKNPPVMVWHLIDSWLGLNMNLFKTYEDAQQACLEKLLEIAESLKDKT